MGGASTFIDCEYKPQFTGSGRGCVLKKSSIELEKRGIVKKSQIEMINGVDISGEPLVKIEQMIEEYSKLGKEYTVQISIPGIDLQTVEITFNGAFCPQVEFTKDYEGNNFIIREIAECDMNKYLINKAELKAGYKIFKIKGSSVLNKPFKDTQQILEKAEKDTRVSYQVR